MASGWLNAIRRFFGVGGNSAEAGIHQRSRRGLVHKGSGFVWSSSGVTVDSGFDPFTCDDTDASSDADDGPSCGDTDADSDSDDGGGSSDSGSSDD